MATVTMSLEEYEAIRDRAVKAETIADEILGAVEVSKNYDGRPKVTLKIIPAVSARIEEQLIALYGSIGTYRAEDPWCCAYDIAHYPDPAPEQVEAEKEEV
jgi:hypothetical protein